MSEGGDEGKLPDPDRREEDDDDDDDERSDAESRKSRSKKKRRKRRHRSRSDSRSSSRGADFKRVLEEALGPITKKLAELSKENGAEASSSDLQEIRERQQLLDIETKAATMKTAGAQSQFRVLAGIKRRVTNSITALDDFMLSLDSPDDPAYAQIAGIKAELGKAEEEASERISLLFKADEDPKVGWSALTMLDKKRNMEKTNPETDKLFASCVRQVQESNKKPKTSDYGSGKRPFRPGPGWSPGNSYSGCLSARGRERERERERERKKERKKERKREKEIHRQRYRQTVILISGQHRQTDKPSLFFFVR